jgi:XTP/dITP diphosphohydrolase
MLLYCATSNPGKILEFSNYARGLGNDGIAITMLPGIQAIQAPEESGKTFSENAIIKARYYSQFAPGFVFAEDSGLSVDALQGAPGVYSARFAGPGATDAANLELLLERMRGIVDRRAHYACVIALARDGAVVTTAEGRADGFIAEEPRGSNGFGYDPVFFHPGLGCTFGETDRRAKQTVSHRGLAMRALIEQLSKG